MTTNPNHERTAMLDAIADYAIQLHAVGSESRADRIARLRAERTIIYQHAYPLDDGPRRRLELAIVFDIDRMIVNETQKDIDERVARGEIPEYR